MGAANPMCTAEHAVFIRSSLALRSILRARQYGILFFGSLPVSSSEVGG